MFSGLTKAATTFAAHDYIQRRWYVLTIKCQSADQTITLLLNAC